MRSPALLFAGVALVLLPPAAQAQETPAEVETPADPASEDVRLGLFEPPPLVAPEVPDGADWVSLHSGEFLQGELKEITSTSLTFDGDEFGVQEVDLDKVARFSTPNEYVWVTIELERHAGAGYIDGDEVVVLTAAGVVRFPRDQLLRVLASSETELDYWSALIRLGVNGTTGNSRQLTSDFYAEIVRSGPLLETRLSYHNVYGMTEREETAKLHEGRFESRLYLSDRFFVTPFIGRALYDKYQNIKLRATAGSGGGYLVFRDGDDFADWSIESQAIFSHVEYRSATPGEDRFNRSAQIRVATRLVWEIVDDVDFNGLYEVYLDLGDIQDTNHHAEVNVAIELFDDFNLTFGLSWDRQERTTRRADGSIPHKDDFRYSVGISYEL